MRQSEWWWFVFEDGTHVRTYGNRAEAMADMETVARERPTVNVRVDRGTRRQAANGGGHVIVSASTGN